MGRVSPSVCDRICILNLIALYDWPVEQAKAIFLCESHLGEDPNAYRLDWANGGVAQINKATWEPYFKARYGWTWEMIVMDDAINLQAAWEIYVRAGFTFTPWTCAELVEVGK